jgi:PAS domain S-box-containing protein
MEKDPRLELIQQQILRFATSDFSVHLPVSEQGDDTDAIIAGLNTLGEELNNKGRINNLLELLLKYTVLDFSEKAEISEKGDEIDALAVGMNSLAEELQFSIDRERKHSQALENANKRLTESEERYRLLTSEVRDYAIILLTPQGNVNSWNLGAERINGYNEKEILGKHFSVFYTKEDLSTNFPEYELSVAKKEGRFENEGWRVKKNGSLYWANVIITALKKDGELLGYSKITRDLTQKKELEDSLKRSNEQLEAVNKELEAFSYSISHDLRAPLRAINGYAQIFQEDFTSIEEEGKRLLSRIQGNAIKMGMLIDDLLAFSRLGRKNIEKSEVNMNELTEGVLSELVKSNDHPATIKMEKLHKVWGDYGLLHQVMFNLVSNAIKYSSKKEKPEITIRSEEQKNEVVFSVKDNGAGFDMRYVDKLFGVFQRLHTMEDFEGTGIGLALVQRIISKHGGRVWAEGKLDQGATFYFSLPKNN